MTKMLPRQSILIACTCALALAPWLCARAHETWLLPLPASGHGPTIDLALTSGMAFPANDYPIKPARVTEAFWRQGRTRGTLEIGASTSTHLVLGARLPHGGAATFALVLPPHPITLNATHVRDYLTDLDAAPSVRERWQRLGHWREHYRKSVKAIAQVAGPGVGDDVTVPVGQPLELVPLRDPQTLRPGAVLEVRVLADGHPLPGLRLQLQEQGMPPRDARSDTDGVVAFRLDRAGTYLVNGVLLHAVDAADRDWDSDFTALTFTLPASHGTTE